jgi:hypothetical protein
MRKKKGKKTIVLDAVRGGLQANRYAFNDSYHCKIIDGKEVEVAAEEDMYTLMKIKIHQRCH